MNPTPETYLEEFRSFPRYLPGGDEYRGGELPHELADGVFSVDRRTEAGWCVFSGISSIEFIGFNVKILLCSLYNHIY
jgi:hypothetical protein